MISTAGSDSGCWITRRFFTRLQSVHRHLAAAALLHEARRMDEAREAREASLAPKPVPAKVIH
jgi:hypothetical protein